MANATTLATETADAVRANADKFTAAGSQAFQQGVDRSLSALNDANQASKLNMEAFVASMTAAARGAEALGAQQMTWAKSALDQNVAAARSLTSARSVQEMIELQTTWARQASESWMTELNRLAETASASFNDTVKPLNERVTATVEAAQAAR
jgi:phasin family protein